MRAMTAREAAELVVDADHIDCVETPAGEIWFLTCDTTQYVIHEHPGVPGAITMTVHRHDDADDAVTCHTDGVQGLQATVAAFKAEITAARSQSMPVGMYV